MAKPKPSLLQVLQNIKLSTDRAKAKKLEEPQERLYFIRDLIHDLNLGGRPTDLYSNQPLAVGGVLQEILSFGTDDMWGNYCYRSDRLVTLATRRAYDPQYVWVAEDFRNSYHMHHLQIPLHSIDDALKLILDARARGLAQISNWK